MDLRVWLKKKKEQKKRREELKEVKHRFRVGGGMLFSIVWLLMKIFPFY